jgi:hypothetical protein
MRGTFRHGERLAITPAPLRDVQPGDVIVYRKPAPHNKVGTGVVHRVIAITPGGLILRGDDNAPDDVKLVLDQYIVGRVTHAIRDARERRVRGGLSSLLAVRFGYWLRRAPDRFRWRTRTMLHLVSQSLYGLLRRSRMVAIVWKPAITQVKVQTTAGPLVEFSHRGRTVVEWWPERGRYYAECPYDLIIFPPDATLFPSELMYSNDP